MAVVHDGSARKLKRGLLVSHKSTGGRRRCSRTHRKRTGYITLFFFPRYERPRGAGVHNLKLEVHSCHFPHDQRRGLHLEVHDMSVRGHTIALGYLQPVLMNADSSDVSQRYVSYEKLELHSHRKLSLNVPRFLRSRGCKDLCCVVSSHPVVSRTLTDHASMSRNL